MLATLHPASNPTPPTEKTPSFMSKAPTPPIGKPFQVDELGSVNIPDERLA